MNDCVALKKKMRIGDKMEFSNGVVYELTDPPVQAIQFNGNIDAKLEEKHSKNWSTVLFKIPLEIKFRFIKGERNVEPT